MHILTYTASAFDISDLDL